MGRELENVSGQLHIDHECADGAGMTTVLTGIEQGRSRDCRDCTDETARRVRRRVWDAVRTPSQAPAQASIRRHALIVDTIVPMFPPMGTDRSQISLQDPGDPASTSFPSNLRAESDLGERLAVYATSSCSPTADSLFSLPLIAPAALVPSPPSSTASAIVSLWVLGSCAVL